MDEVLEAAKDDIDTKLFLYETPSFQWVQSSVYKYADFRESLYVMATQGVAGKKFYIGEDVTNGHVYGLVNIAAFLAQSMKETIKYDACDESSWDSVGGVYPLSNACGQLVSSKSLKVVIVFSLAQTLTILFAPGSIVSRLSLFGRREAHGVSCRSQHVYNSSDTCQVVWCSGPTLLRT
jgi:hypothetical protein